MQFFRCLCCSWAEMAHLSGGRKGRLSDFRWGCILRSGPNGLPNSRLTKGHGFEVICPVSRLSISPMFSPFSPRAQEHNYYQGSNNHASIEPWWWIAWVLLGAEELGLEWTSGGHYSQHSSVCGPWSGRHQAVARKLWNNLVFQYIHSFPHVGASEVGAWGAGMTTVTQFSVWNRLEVHCRNIALCELQFLPDQKGEVILGWIGRGEARAKEHQLNPIPCPKAEFSYIKTFLPNIFLTSS